MTEAAQSKPSKPVFLTDENFWLQDYIDELQQWISGEAMDPATGMTVPRLGVYSLISHNCPAFVYDNPVLMEEIVDTAFTDSVYTYYCADFLKKCIAEDERTGTSNVLYLMLHEYSHMLLRHHLRAMDYPNDDRNEGFDDFINPMLIMSFPDIKPGKVITEYGCGFAPEDVRYVKMAEEDIIREIYEARQKQQQPQPNQPGQGRPGQGQPGQGQPQPGKGQSGNGQPQSGKGQPGGQGQPGKGQPGKGQPGAGRPGKGDNHVVDMETMADALEKAGLGGVAGKLELPRDGDGDPSAVAAARADLDAKTEAHIVDAAGKIRDLTERGARIPGAHINAAIGQLIADLTKPKMTWKLPLRNMIMGGGLRTSRMPEMAHRVTAAVNQQGQRTWIPATVPAKNDVTMVEIIDTSMSMGESDLREALEESVGMIKQAGSRAAKVLIFFTDTRLRGEPFVLTARNVEEVIRVGVTVLGRGGTNLTNNVNEVMQHKLVQEAVKKRRLGGVVMFSDLGDAPMLKEDMHKDLPRNFTIVATGNTYSKTWADQTTAGITFPLNTRPKVDLTRRI